MKLPEMMLPPERFEAPSQNLQKLQCASKNIIYTQHTSTTHTHFYIRTQKKESELVKGRYSRLSSTQELCVIDWLMTIHLMLEYLEALGLCFSVVWMFQSCHSDQTIPRSASLCKLWLQQEMDCYINGLTVLCASNVQLGTLARHFSRLDEGCVW